MKRIACLFLSVLVMVFPGRVSAESILYHTYRAAVSLTVASLETDTKGKKVIVTRRFTNKQIINLSQGRPLEAPVPANELLVWLLPDDYRRADNARLALMDRNTASVLKVIFASDPPSMYEEASNVGFGGSGGKLFKGTQSVSVPALGSATDSLGPASGSGSFAGSDRVSGGATATNLSVLALALSLDLKLNGVTRSSLVTGGSVRMVGSNLLDFYADL